MADRKIREFRDLLVWQKSMTLAVDTMRSVSRGDWSLALSDQIGRTAVSVPSNIAEGFELSTASYRHHLRIALGSLAELETQIELAHRLSVVDAETCQRLTSLLLEVRWMLRRLRSVLRASL